MTQPTWITDSNGNKCSIEYWLPIQGYRDSYEVSTAGTIRSRDRVNVNRKGIRRFLRGKSLKPSIDSEGYYEVGLFRDGKEVKSRIHRLVALAFVKNPLGKPLVDHINRDRLDSSVANLRWVSHAENRANSIQSSRILAAKSEP